MPDDNEGAVLNNGDPGVDGGGGKDGAAYDPGEDKSDADLYLDNIYFGDDDEGEGDEGKPSKKGEKKSGDEGKAPDVQQLQAEIDKLKTDKVNLNRALHEERQSKKKAKTDEAEDDLTDAQLKDLMKEHHDDPDALFNIVQYMARKVAKGEKKAALNEAEIANKRRDIDIYISKRNPDYADPESEIRKEAEKTKAQLGLEDHPYADILALGVNAYLSLPEIMKQVYAKGKEDALKEAAETNRKKDVKNSSLTPKGEGGKSSHAPALTKDIAAVAKQMNMTPGQAKVYQRLMSSKGGHSITVEG